MLIEWTIFGRVFGNSNRRRIAVRSKFEKPWSHQVMLWSQKSHVWEKKRSSGKCSSFAWTQGWCGAVFITGLGWVIRGKSYFTYRRKGSWTFQWSHRRFLCQDWINWFQWKMRRVMNSIGAPPKTVCGRRARISCFWPHFQQNKILNLKSLHPIRV